jgi:hypothetical protein
VFYLCLLCSFVITGHFGYREQDGKRADAAQVSFRSGNPLLGEGGLQLSHFYILIILWDVYYEIRDETRECPRSLS